MSQSTFVIECLLEVFNSLMSWFVPNVDLLYEIVLFFLLFLNASSSSVSDFDDFILNKIFARNDFRL